MSETVVVRPLVPTLGRRSESVFGLRRNVHDLTAVSTATEKTGKEECL